MSATPRANDLTHRSATELAALVRDREVSSVELTSAYLARIDVADRQLNAVVTIDAERAIAEATAADEATVRGLATGPLHGLPMTVKDTFETAGMRTTAGAPELAEHVPMRDAIPVERLRAAGAVLIGKTNVPPYAMDWQAANPIFGVTRNPFDPARTPGGSSGGAAAAVAAGMTALELGSDIRGSIRVPAHFCGVYGLKPTGGIVPTRGHIPGPPGTLAEPDLAAIGPLVRSADDLGLALDVLAGPGPERGKAWRLDLPAARADHLAGYRVAAWLDDVVCPVDAEVLEVLQRATAALENAGGKVDGEARPVALAEAKPVFEALFLAATSAGYPRPVFDELCAVAASHPDAHVARDVTQRVRDWHLTNEHRLQLGARWADFFTRHDVLLCPAAPVAAFPHDATPDMAARTLSVNGRERPYSDLSPWVGLASAVHLPAAVVPVGRTRSGLPVGIQVIGPHLEDRTVIDVARRLAEVIGPLGHPELGDGTD
jgi:amidase